MSAPVPPRCPHAAEVDAHFAGTLPPEATRAFWAHLPACASCSARYEKHLVLESLDPALAGPKERMLRGLPIPSQRRGGGGKRAVAGATAVLALAASALLFVGRSHPDDGFRARGVATTASRQPRFEVYRVAKDSASPGSSRVTERIGRSDALAVAYTNPEGSKRGLLVFATDEHRHVYWYYPAWNRAEETPEAVPIRPSAELVELPEAVVHPFDGSKLRIHAVFVDGKVTVKDVEAKVEASAPLAPSLAIEGAFEESRLVEVE